MHRKALYNLLKFTSIDKKPKNVENWQIEDLRKIDLDILFKKLHKFDIFLDNENFLKYSKNFFTPEEFSSFLSDEKDLQQRDQIYLIIFELWRRFAQDKKSISIFCDELDHRIFEYDNNKMKNDEKIQNHISMIKSILDENVDAGESHKKVFNDFTKFLAHDYENFLLDYISDLIDIKNYSYALDLIDSYYSYFNAKNWLDFLKAKIFSVTNINSSKELFENILLKLKNKSDLELQFRILDFLSYSLDRSLFISFSKEMFKIVENEKNFKCFLEILLNFFERIDDEKKAAEIRKILKKRESIKKMSKLKKTNIDLLFLKKVIL
ncbi:MAG: hypothetical protein A3F40_01775 [Chlamydiae bacterium RIFCSPHIGHO2_12_FULL_27_8]|nr:MAG: hypothetical protein A3F40_01775 [Chlamydiae bacterium RIFCSPHIGHO2_12_FULL_27_8]